jgi:hypothetical protein
MVLTDQHFGPDVLTKAQEIARSAFLCFEEPEPQLEAQPFGFYVVVIFHLCRP